MLGAGEANVRMINLCVDLPEEEEICANYEVRFGEGEDFDGSNFLFYELRGGNLGDRYVEVREGEVWLVDLGREDFYERTRVNEEEPNTLWRELNRSFPPPPTSNCGTCSAVPVGANNRSLMLLLRLLDPVF